MCLTVSSITHEDLEKYIKEAAKNNQRTGQYLVNKFGYPASMMSYQTMQKRRELFYLPENLFRKKIHEFVQIV